VDEDWIKLASYLAAQELCNLPTTKEQIKESIGGHIPWDGGSARATMRKAGWILRSPESCSCCSERLWRVLYSSKRSYRTSLRPSCNCNSRSWTNLESKLHLIRICNLVT